MDSRELNTGSIKIRIMCRHLQFFHGICSQDFRNRARIRQAILEKEIIESKLEEAKKQIELQVINTLNELLTAEKGIIAAEKPS